MSTTFQAIANGNFETGDFTGWSIGPAEGNLNLPTVVVENYNPPGTHVARLTGGAFVEQVFENPVKAESDLTYFELRFPAGACGIWVDVTYSDSSEDRGWGTYRFGNKLRK
jgi:hypothetical protein